MMMGFMEDYSLFFSKIPVIVNLMAFFVAVLKIKMYLVNLPIFFGFLVSYSTVISPFLPGRMGSSGHSEAVQLQDACTSLIIKAFFPVFSNLNVYEPSPLKGIFPKLWVFLLKVISALAFFSEEDSPFCPMAVNVPASSTSSIIPKRLMSLLF